MNKRAIALAGITAIAMSGVSASAATKKPLPKTCNLVKDASGDAATAPLPSSDTLDVLSADVASDKKTVEVVLRLKSLGVDPTAPLGQIYSVNFDGQGGDTHSFLSYLVVPNGSSFTYGHYDASTNINTGDGTAEGVVDTAKKEVRIWVPVDALSAHGNFKPGAKITGINVTTARWVGAYVDDGTYAGEEPTADTATASKDYVAGAPTCVTIGK